MHVALAFNSRGESVSCEETSLLQALFPSASPDDLFAEWDAPATIEAVAQALSRHHRVSLVHADFNAFETFRSLRPDLVFNMAEGLLGSSREAQIPAMLEMLGLPYTGSDPLTLGLCLDKRRTKEILSHHRVPTPRFFTASCATDLPARLRYPLMVKPALEGSSKGITDRAYVRNRRELLKQLDWVVQTYRQPAIVEEYLPGREFTVALLGNGDSVQVLPVVEICLEVLPEGASPIYSYEAKWIWDQEEAPLEIFACPASLDSFLQKSIEKVAREAFACLGCRDWCRIDIRLDASGHPHIIELNPLPGILPDPRQNSCFPKAARAFGLSYDQMIQAVVDAACQRLALPQGGIYEDRRML